MAVHEQPRVKPSVYIETTFVSYLTARPSNSLVNVARQEISRRWWAGRDRYDLYISQLVIDEAIRGDADAAKARTELLHDIPQLEIVPETASLVRVLMERHALPATAQEDAIHVALAAYHGMNYLLTWNCKHIANASLAYRIRQTIEDEGFACPIICVPEVLLEESDDWP